MQRLLDARGLACPVPALKARAALTGLGPGDALVVLATDPEAPVDVGALAADDGHGFEACRDPDGAWRMRIALTGPPPPPRRRAGDPPPPSARP